MVVNATASTQSMWLDGRLIGTNTGLTIATRTNGGGADPTRMGGGYFNGAFEGQVGETRIYDDATQDGSALSLSLANFYGGNYTLQQLYTFANAGSGAWNAQSNWSPSGVPNDIVNHQVLINNGGTASIGSSETFSVSDLFVGTTSLSSGSVVSAGTLNIGNSLNVGNGGTGHLVQTGGAINAGLTFLLGANGGTASYDMSGGTLTAPGFAIAGGAGSLNSASMTLHGTASVSIVNGNPFRVGDGGTGRLDISDTAQLNTGSSEFWVGNGTGSTGTFTQSGGTTLIGNWFTLGRGGASTTVDISGGTVTKQGGGNTFVDENGGGSSTMTVRGTGAYIAQTGEFWVANNGGAIGTLNIQDSGAVTVQSSWVAIGRNGGSGTVNMSGNSTFQKTGGNGTNFILADASGSVGNLTLSGNSSVLVGVGTLEIGNNGGAGSLTIMNNGSVTVTSGESHVGNSGTGVLNVQDSGSLFANNWLAIGRNGGTGTLNLNGGTINKAGNGNITIGAVGTANGTVNQTAGQIISARNLGDAANQGLIGGEVYVGETANGTWNMSGGSASVPGANVGFEGMGTLNLSGTASISTPFVAVGRSAASAGTANLNGGTISTAQIYHGGGSGNSVVNFNGTTVTPTGDNDRFITGFGSGSLVLQSGGAVIDTAGHNIGIDSGFSGAGPLVKNGAGVMTINAGANNTHSGATVINAGSIKLQHVVSNNSLLANGVSAYYQFNDASNIGKDSSPNGDDVFDVFGTATITTATAPPDHTGSLSLPNNFSNADFLSTADGNVPANFPTGNSSYTLAAWINVDGTNTAGTNGIIGWGDEGATAGLQRSSITFRTQNNNNTPNGLRNSWFIQDISSNLNSGSTLVNQWHHVTATYDANTDTRKIYIDGQLLVSDFEAGVNNATSANFRIGETVLGELLSGNMADLLVTRSALTQAQIQQLINSGLMFGSFSGASGALSPNSLMQIAGGAILDLNGASSPSGGLGNVGAGGGTVTSSSSGSAVLGVNPIGSAAFSGVVEDGAGTVGLTKSGPGTQTLSGNNTYTGTSTVQGGRLVLAGAVRRAQSWLTVEAAPMCKPDDSSSITPAAPIPPPRCGSILTSGFNQATKFSSGKIESSTATTAIGLGYADDATAHQVTVAYAYYGDANLDGTVNALDFNALATSFGQSGTAWNQGDFNYDNTVNTSDFMMMANDFGQTLPPDAPALGALVPEPGMFAVSMALLRRCCGGGAPDEGSAGLV